MSAPRTVLSCATHGKTPWTGQVICKDCFAVWHLDVPADCPPTTDGTCTCGKPLTGPEGTARAICSGCYIAKKTAASATLPN